MSILPKAIWRVHALPIKIPMTYFIRTRPNISKIRMEPQKALNSNSDPEKEQVGGLTLPNIKLYLRL